MMQLDRIQYSLVRRTWQHSVLLWRTTMCEGNADRDGWLVVAVICATVPRKGCQSVYLGQALITSGEIA